MVITIRVVYETVFSPSLDSLLRNLELLVSTAREAEDKWFDNKPGYKLELC